MFVSPVVLYEEINHNFSSGQQIANYINTNLKEEKEFIVVGNPFLFSSISAYLPDKKFYSVIFEDYITYTTYKTKEQIKQIPFPKNAIYNIVEENIDLKNNSNFVFVFASDNENLSSKTEREVFKMYKLN